MENGLDAISRMMSALDTKMAPLNNIMDITRNLQKSTDALNMRSPALDMLSQISNISLSYNSTMQLMKSISEPPAYLKSIMSVSNAFHTSNTIGSWMNSYKSITDLNVTMDAIALSNPILQSGLFEKITAFDKTFEHIHKITNIAVQYQSIANIIGNSIAFDESNWDDEINDQFQNLIDGTEQIILNTPTTIEEANKYLNEFYIKTVAYFKESELAKFVFLSLIMPVLAGYLTSLLSGSSTTTNNYFITETRDEGYKIESKKETIIINSIIKEVRTKPRKDYKVIYKLPIGSEITLIKKSRKWAKISYVSINGDEGIGWLTLEGLDE